jgi:hypothetical protein
MTHGLPLPQLNIIVIHGKGGNIMSSSEEEGNEMGAAVFTIFHVSLFLLNKTATNTTPYWQE